MAQQKRKKLSWISSKILEKKKRKKFQALNENFYFISSSQSQIKEKSISSNNNTKFYFIFNAEIDTMIYFENKQNKRYLALN